MPATLDDALAGALNFLPRPGRKGLPPTVVRPLGEEDLLTLAGQPGETLSPLQRIRESHHMAARLMAEGRKNVEVSAMTGYTPERISQFKADPAFKELLAYYQAQVGGKYLNVHERLATLGITATEELLERLDERPEEFSNSELLDLATKSLDRAGFGPKATVEHKHQVGLSAETLERLKAERPSGTVRSVDEILDAEFSLPALEAPNA